MKLQIEDFKSILEGNYYLIITSNNKEKDAVNGVLSSKFRVNLELNSKGSYIGLIDENVVIHISGTSGIVSDDSIGRLIIEFISNNKFPNPKLVLMVGFCWGNPNKTKTGEIIISNCVFSLNSSVAKDSHIEFKVRVYQSSLSQEFLKADCINGPLASLETLIANDQYRENIINQYPTIVGGEMEGFGFIPTLQSRQLPWLIIKGISDFADNNYGRETQEIAVKRSASFISKLLQEIKPTLETDNVNDNQPYEHLKNLLRGKSIRIARTEFKDENLNDYLNDIIGPVIESKLKEYFYSTDETGDSTFTRYFCDAILEIAQNSFKHGKSSSFEISFHSKTIILTEDGDDFELSEISGQGGGATAWKKIYSHFIESGFVRYSHERSNIYKFHLESVKDFLRNLREKCSVNIIPGTIGTGYYPSQILEYNESCTSVFINDKHNRMSSRRISVINGVKSLLDKGLTVYLSVHNKYEAKEYAENLVDYGDNLIIIYD